MPVQQRLTRRQMVKLIRGAELISSVNGESVSDVMGKLLGVTLGEEPETGPLGRGRRRRRSSAPAPRANGGVLAAEGE